MVVDVYKLLTVTALYVETFVWFLRIDFKHFTTFQTLFKFLAQTHFFLSFRYFVCVETMRTIEISLAVLAVNSTFLSWGKIWTASIIFLRPCALTTIAITASTGMVSGIIHIESFTAIRAKVGSVEKSGHAS